jgi:tetratricopeptide (TPR) repeat protein
VRRPSLLLFFFFSSLALLPCHGAAPADGLSTLVALLDDGRYAEARLQAERALASGEAGAEARILLARACNALGDYEAGARHAREAIDLRPESSEARYRLAEALRVKMTRVSRTKGMLVVGSYKEALARAIELDPANVLAREEQIGFLIHAPAIVGGSKDRAAERIAELRPLDGRRALLAESTLLVERGDPEDAVALLEQALVLYPGDFTCRHALAELLVARGRHEEAERHLVALAATANPIRAAAVLYTRAFLRLRGGFELEKAAGFLREFLSRVPTDMAELPDRATAWADLGRAYEGLGRQAQARDAYRRSLDLDPGRREAKDGLARAAG